MSLIKPSVTISQTSHSDQYARPFARPWRLSISQDTMWRLLLLSALGPMFSNVLIFQMGGFAVTLPHLLLGIAAATVFLKSRRVNSRLALICVVMILIQICHALVSGFVVELEWRNSFAQFVTYTTCFILLTGFKMDHNTSMRAASWTMQLGIFLGGINILQFILFGFGVPAYLPDMWQVRGLDPFGVTYRYGDFRPAFGLATEPSLHALGLVTLLACLLFLRGMGFVPNRRMWILSIITLLGAIVVSFSLTGIIIAGTLILTSLLFLRAARRLAFILFIVGMAFGIFAGGIVDPIRSRLQRVSLGADNSAQVRVVGAVRLLFAPSSSFETFVFGTGLGMETRELGVYQGIYSEVSLRSGEWDVIKIHNILTVVKVLQGWIGVVLYIILLWKILQPLTRKFRLYTPLFVLVILYHFTSGYYLVPFFWSMLALMVVLRRLPFQSESNQVHRPTAASQLNWK